jgi:flagellar biosynthesis component FlhA
MPNNVKKHIYRAMWLIAVVVFFLGLYTGYAQISWLVFVVVAAIQALLEALNYARANQCQAKISTEETVAEETIAEDTVKEEKSTKKAKKQSA